MYLSPSAISELLSDATFAADRKTNGLMDKRDLAILVGRLAEAIEQTLADAQQFQYERDEFARRLTAALDDKRFFNAAILNSTSFQPEMTWGEGT